MQIKNRYTDEIVFSSEKETIKKTVEEAIAFGADLTGARLTDADLTNADLTGARLTDADLTGARLTGARLTDADLTGADLTGARLTDADLTGADLTVPVIEKLHNKILFAIENGGKLNMQTWHTCETTHCRAGWAIHLAGDQGKKLEVKYGPSVAGALIHLASCSFMDRVPNFFASNEDALIDIKNCAQKEIEEETNNAAN